MKAPALKLLTLAPLQGVFAWRLRRFGDPGLRARLREIGHAFLDGYRAALEESPDLAAVSARLSAVEPELQGFAAEGVGLGLSLLDCLAPEPSRGKSGLFRRFSAGCGVRHVYMLHVGSGWALAVPGVAPQSLIGCLDPEYWEMALDGYGFYRAYFFWRRAVRRARRPSWLGPGGASFDVGVGRRLWFLDTPGVEPMLEVIAGFPESRRGDLWTGLGEACCFAGGRPGAAAVLRERAGAFLPWLAQGVAFSAEVRERAGIQAPHAEEACRAIWDRSAAAAAEATRAARPAADGLDGDPAAPVHAWRRRLRERFIRQADRYGTVTHAGGPLSDPRMP
jgi:enediyne biosynthesis protein E3